MDLTFLFPLLILLLFIPLFLSGRRQRRQLQEMQDLQASLAVDDEVMTTSGLRATVVDTAETDTIELEIAPGVTTTWVRAAIRERINPPGSEQGEDAEDGSDDAAESSADDGTAVEDKAGEARSNGSPGSRT